MDHLELPPNPASQHITVPYFCTEPYDGGEFTAYPQRVGWKQHGFQVSGFWKDRDPRQTTAFLQTWLFFGMMESMFDLKVETPDFVSQTEDGKQCVTTKKLPHYIQRWLAKMQTGGSDYLSSRIKAMQDIISTAAYMAQNFKDSSKHLVPAVLDPTVALSIQLLGRTLAHVCDEFVQDKFTSAPGRLGRDTLFEGSELVVQRAVAAGWCPNQIARFVRIDEQYYASSIDRHWRGRTHESCTAQQCIEDNVVEASYERAHSMCRHPESCAVFEFPAEGAKDILGAGGIPVLALAIRPPLDVGGDIIDARQVTAHNLEYTAISHVWADGLGNPSANGVQKCQLLRLYLLACSQDQRKLFYSEDRLEAGNIVFVWLDTYCVPLQKEYRKVAIHRMAETYRHAKRTLVLDQELQETRLASQTFPELCARIRGSRWMSRVWTFQEALLSQDLRLFFEDGEIELDKLKKMEEKHYSTNRLDPLVYNCADILPFRTGEIGEEPRRFLQAWNGFTTRSTSRRGDEILCLASVLGKDAGPLIDHSPGEDRLIALAAQLRVVPAALLFSHGPYSEKAGFSWMPLSLLGYEGKPILWDSSTLGVNEACRTEDGLVLPRPGIIFDCHALLSEGSNIRSNVYVFSLSGRWYFVHPIMHSWTASSWASPGSTQPIRCGVIFKKIEWEDGTRGGGNEVAIVCVHRVEDGVIHCSFKSLGNVFSLTELGVEQPRAFRCFSPTSGGTEEQVNQSNLIRDCQLDSTGRAAHWIPKATLMDNMQLWCVG